MGDRAIAPLLVFMLGVGSLVMGFSNRDLLLAWSGMLLVVAWVLMLLERAP